MKQNKDLLQYTINENLANYFAGFVDGEGCFKIYLNRTRNGWDIRLDIAQSDYEFLNKLRSDIGIGGAIVKINPHNYMFVISSKKLRYLLPYIIPYLRLKKEQAKLVLLASQTISNRYCKMRDLAVDRKVKHYADLLHNLKPCNFNNKIEIEEEEQND